MPVSSDISTHLVLVEPADRDDYGPLKSVWLQDAHAITHSRAPAPIVSEAESRNIQLFKIYDESNELVAFFPFEKSKFLGVDIIRPAFYELTLDFIDLTALPQWLDWAVEIFYDWIEHQPNTAFDIFMCDENSVLVRKGLESSSNRILPRGTYFYLNLPKTYEDFVSSLSRSPRQKNRKIDRDFQVDMRFEVVRGEVLGDELARAFSDLVKLHKNVFPADSAMLPYRHALESWVNKGFSEGVVFFVRVREISTGEVVATELMVESNGYVGLMQGGRRIESRYLNIGSWLLAKTIEWSISEGKTTFEFLLGDQEYKRRLATGSRDAVSITHFTSKRARYTYRIRQRLGRYIKSLR